MQTGDEQERVDLLIDKNTTDQLSGVDWDRLNEAISTRLDEADARKKSPAVHRYLLKTAAAITAAAAVVFIVLMINVDRPTDAQLEDGGSASVAFVDNRGSASVSISDTAGKTEAIVDIDVYRVKVARCDVEIIDVGAAREDDERPTWIMISKPEPLFADNGTSRADLDLICLF